jgi:hypothetical protein
VKKKKSFEDRLCPCPQGADISTLRTRELHYTQSPGKQQITQKSSYNAGRCNVQFNEYVKGKFHKKCRVRKQGILYGTVYRTFIGDRV